MMDYYGDQPGPTQNEAIKILTSNIKKYNSFEKKFDIFDKFTYLNEEIIDSIIITTVETTYGNNTNIGSFTGWIVYLREDLCTIIFKKLHNENEKIKQEHKKKLCAAVISLQGLLSSDILNNKLLKI